MSNAQVWLTVFEDHRDSIWPPTHETCRWRVELKRSVTILDGELEPPFRTSPVFPLSSNFAVPNLESGEYYICLMCFDPAFPVLGRIITESPDVLAPKVLFSLGLASVILVTQDLRDLQEVERIASVAARSREVWTVKDGLIISFRCECFGNFAFTLPKVLSYSVLPLPARTAVDEFVSSLALLVPKLAIHVPSELTVFEFLAAAVNELIEEMIFVVAPTGPAPHSLEGHSPDEFGPGKRLTETVLNQNTDRLVQINAAMSYVSTQALSGSVPILERRSLIRRHSLLGIGTAILALNRTARSVERAFQEGGVEAILESGGGHTKPLPGLTNLPSYDPTGWGAESVSTRPNQPGPSEPKIAYFSGRLGFRESEYAISAAIESISAGAAPEWSVLTLTHEMLHGHIRSLLTVIMEGEPVRTQDEAWDEFFARFSRRVRDHSDGDDGFVDSIRAVLLFYACLSATYGSLTREPSVEHSVGAGEPVTAFFRMADSSAALTKQFQFEYRNISEILVHVLDLHYFYGSNLSAYLQLIWRSWAPLPQVKVDVRQYVLRSLLIAAAKATGRAGPRFHEAARHVREAMQPLANGDYLGSSAVQAAILLLDSKPKLDELFLPFRAGLILVDLADRVLTSAVIRGALNRGDAHLVPANDPGSFEAPLVYEIEDGFIDDEIAAPTMYLADRLRRRIGTPIVEDLEFETVRMFLACCSKVPDDGRDL